MIETADSISGTPGRAARPAWPAAIGVLSIVVACQELYELGLEWSGFLLAKVSRSYISAMQPDPILSAPSALIAILLAAAGICLIRRSQRALMHTGYAITKLVWIFFLLFLSWRETGQYRPDFAVILYALLRTVRAAAYPVFLLIWFHRPNIREQISQWASGRDAR